jgi:hypothetical protein
MDKSKLANIRLEQSKKRNKQVADRHDALLKSNDAIKSQLELIWKELNGQEKYNDSKLLEQIDVLASNTDLKSPLEGLQKAIEAIPKTEEVEVSNLKELIEAVKNSKVEFSNKDVVNALSNLTVSVKALTFSQDPIDFVPMRRVIQVGNKLTFDDTTGGGGGASFVSGTYPILSTDGLATEAKQDDIITAIDGIGGSVNYATKIDDTTTANVIYIGNAAIGSSGASAVWQIKKLNTASIALDKTWAAGSDAFTNVWDNRSSLSYS